VSAFGKILNVVKKINETFTAGKVKNLYSLPPSLRSCRESRPKSFIPLWGGLVVLLPVSCSSKPAPQFLPLSFAQG